MTGKAHDIVNAALSGTTMTLRVDGREYRIDVTKHSARLARATQQQREKFEISASGYGIHWPEVDEDLSVDGLIGVKHASPLAARTA
jgi:hypothetical protein